MVFASCQREKCFPLSKISHFNRKPFEEPLKQIWEKSELLEKLRRKENLKGQCGGCEIKDCRGCRSLVLALTGDYLEEDPHCWYHDV